MMFMVKIVPVGDGEFQTTATSADGKVWRKRYKSWPDATADYEWRELESLMTSLGYRLENGGGSRRRFIHSVTKVVFMMHEPHPRKVLKHYQIKDVIDFLKQEKHIK
jgi:hypothetical protein